MATRMKKHSRRKKELGASLVEYALLVALIALVAIASIRLLGNATTKTFEDLNYKGFDAAGGFIPCNPSNPSYPAC